MQNYIMKTIAFYLTLYNISKAGTYVQS